MSVEEIKRLLFAPKNLNHKAIFTVLYCAGLDLGEVINLRIEDIYSDEVYIFIKGAIGKKDKNKVLSTSLLPMLQEYYRKHRPSHWLFEAQENGQYTPSSVQMILHNALIIRGNSSSIR